MAETVSRTGLSKETAGALAVILGPTLIGPLVFMFLEKDPFVRFHALQILVVLIILGLVQWVLQLTVVLSNLGGLVTIAAFTLWLVLVYKAWQGVEWEVPVFGELARKLIKKV